MIEKLLFCKRALNTADNVIDECNRNYINVFYKALMGDLSSYLQENSRVCGAKKDMEFAKQMLVDGSKCITDYNDKIAKLQQIMNNYEQFVVSGNAQKRTMCVIV